MFFVEIPYVKVQNTGFYSVKIFRSVPLYTLETPLETETTVHDTIKSWGVEGVRRDESE